MKLINIFIICQKLVNNILAEYLNIFAIIYFDNIFIYSKTLKKYILYIKTVFDKFLLKELLIKTEKYNFYKYKIDFLGFIIGRYRIWINLKKI